MVKRILCMLAVVALNLLLFTLFKDSPRPVEASERTGGIIQQHIISNFIALLWAFLYFCTNVFFSNMFQHCSLEHMQYFMVNVWQHFQQLKLKSQIVCHYKTSTNEHHKATTNSWVLYCSHHIHGHQRYCHNPRIRPVKIRPLEEIIGWGG